MSSSHYSYVRGPKPHHILPLKLYWSIFVALVALTIATVLLNQINFGWFSIVLTLFLASIKSFLVLSVFMHLWFDDKIYVGMLVVSLGVLLILISFTLTDINSRAWFDKKRDNYVPRNEVVERHRIENPDSPALRPGLRG